MPKIKLPLLIRSNTKGIYQAVIPDLKLSIDTEDTLAHLADIATFLRQYCSEPINKIIDDFLGDDYFYFLVIAEIHERILTYMKENKISYIAPSAKTTWVVKEKSGYDFHKWVELEIAVGAHSRSRNFVRRSLVTGFLLYFTFTVGLAEWFSYSFNVVNGIPKNGAIVEAISDSFLNMLVLFATNIVGSMGLLANVLCRATLPDHNYTHAHHFEITKGLNLATKIVAVAVLFSEGYGVVVTGISNYNNQMSVYEQAWTAGIIGSSISFLDFKNLAKANLISSLGLAKAINFFFSINLIPQKLVNAYENLLQWLKGEITSAEMTDYEKFRAELSVKEISPSIALTIDPSKASVGDEKTFVPAMTEISQVPARLSATKTEETEAKQSSLINKKKVSRCGCLSRLTFFSSPKTKNSNEVPPVQQQIPPQPKPPSMFYRILGYT